MKKRIQQWIDYLSSGTFEREEVLALSLLSALSGESIFLLGLPGVGKSMVARRLKAIFRNAKVYEYLMSRFSTPDEIFGPVSISKLKNEDAYERMTKGYLPEAEIIFLDEIWKAGPAIQNSLLTVLNEKIFHNGSRDIRLPVKAIIAASNELPALGESLEALWDRFLIRYIVKPIEKKNNFFGLIDGNDVEVALETIHQVSDEEYNDIRRRSAIVGLPDEIKEFLYIIRSRLNERGSDSSNELGGDSQKGQYYVSDRRWKKAVNVMKTSACLNDRTIVDFSDVFLLAHMLWNDDAAIPVVQRLLAEELAAFLFSDIVKQRRSVKRHTVVKPVSAPYYTPDKIHYVVQCNGCSLKLKISDYKMMRRNEGSFYYASEDADECLVIGDGGYYSMKVYKDGHVCINGCNYPLVTTTDVHLGQDFLQDVNEQFNGMVNDVYRSVQYNPFVKDMELTDLLRKAIYKYQERLEENG